MLLGLMNAESEGWVFFPLLMAFLAVLYLLPSPRRRPALIVVDLAMAVIFISLAIFHDTPLQSAEEFLFFAFSILAITFAVLMISQRNPARSALFFAVVVLSVCGLFLLLGAPFLMGASIIIYAGAIIVTFLFIIMLSQQARPTDANDRSREPSLAAAIGFLLLGALLVVQQRTWRLGDVDELIRESDRYARIEGFDKGPRIRDQPFLDRVVQARKQFGFGAIEIPSTPEHPKDSDGVEEMRNALGLTPAIPGPEGEDRPSKPQIDEVRRAGAQIRYELSYLKAVRQGGIDPIVEGLELSSYGQSMRVDTPDDPADVGPKRLPAANIAALGRALFADHLIAVELAGTLLLIATIGAISIAGHREKRLNG